MVEKSQDIGTRQPEWAAKILNKEESISAWSGSPHDLLVLATAIDKRVQPLRTEALKSFDQHFREHKLVMHLPWIGRSARDDRGEARLAIERRCTVTVELADRENATTTNIFSAIDESDRFLTNATKIIIKGEVKDQGSGEVKDRASGEVRTQSCSVTFGTNGNRLQVQGDTWWVRDTLVDIKSVLKENRPIWWIMRSGWFLWPFFAVIAIAGYVIGIESASDSLWIIAFLLGPYIVIPLILWIILSIFPRFEVRSAKKSNLRQTVIRVALGVLAILVSLTSIASGVYSITKGK